MGNKFDILEHHYKSGLKLDYFILTIDLALLGWMLVNTEWLPKGKIYSYLMAGFYIIVALSIICGIIRQLYNGKTFALNHLYIKSKKFNNEEESNRLWNDYWESNNAGAKFAHISMVLLAISLFLLTIIKVYSFN